MGELDIKRGIAFLRSPKCTPYSVKAWSKTQKVDFLRRKLPEKDVEEVLRRVEEENPGQESTEEVKAEVQIQGFGVYALAGAGIIGALSSALFFV